MSASRLRIQPLAEQDIAEAQSWYERQQSGLGAEFLARIDRCMRQIETSPRAFQIVHRNVRRALVDRFPYCVFFVATNDEIVVLAVLHGHRNPASWGERL